MKAVINEIEKGNMQILKHEKWLQYLVLTNERSINLERMTALGDINGNKVLAYVFRTFDLLNTLKLNKADKDIIFETLKWCEVAKCGLPHKRAEWMKKGYNLFAHNIGSAEIYKEDNPDAENGNLIYTLIQTHGLIGQYIRGEVPLKDNKPLYVLVAVGEINAHRLKVLLTALNYCVIGAVDIKIWERVSKDVEFVIDKIIAGDFTGQDLKARLKALRSVSIANGEDFEAEYAKLQAPAAESIQKLLDNSELWYLEAALYDFTFAEFVKILLFIASKKVDAGHISFELLMNCIYYDYQGKKRINVYKKRIIEKYLAFITALDILQGKTPEIPHVKHLGIEDEKIKRTCFFTFEFSPAGEKLIGFCVEAEKAGAFYEKAVVLLFDLFDLRRDKFDRFNNEEKYLSQMNDSMHHKKVMLDYITGN